MKILNIFYVLIGIFTVTTISSDAHARRVSYSVDASRAKDGAHGLPGYFEDGEHGQNGEDGKNGQDGGHGGNGGSSTNGSGGDGGNGGDAD